MTNSAIHTQLANRIKHASLLHGTFQLRSGVTADRYFDKYLFESDPQLLQAIATALTTLLPPDAEVLAGLEMGGIPIVTALSLTTGLPAAFMRKEAKSYGTCQYAEGTPLAGKKVVLIEDVVSSGGAMLDALAKLRRDGIEPDMAICVIDRQTGGKENLANAGLELRSLFTIEQIMES
jgi:orotate phosphoribosyltransferase